jgi:arabinose-5-phosphate isomerase
MSEIRESAVKTLTIEANAITNLLSRINGDFTKAVELITEAKGRLIITGMGKSGVIGMKLAATFSSTGTPSFFLHPAEAIHGDLGMIKSDDLILALSYSGETDELLKIVPFLQDYSCGMIAMTGNDRSSLAKAANIHIDVKVEKEACPNNLAPTASTTATLAMGDAIAVAVMEKRQFKPEHFARFHPGGSLGRKLLTKVADVMNKNNLPIVALNAPIKQVIDQITAGKLGLVIVHEPRMETIGIITDGDLRRSMDRAEDNFFSLIAKDIMTPEAKTITSGLKIGEAEKIMNEHKISALVVRDEKDITGVVQIYDVQ